MVVCGAYYDGRPREASGSPRMQAFLVRERYSGAILGSTIPLAEALRHGWQFGLLGVAALAFLVGRRGVVQTLVGAGVIGANAVLELAGEPAHRVACRPNRWAF